MRVAVGLVLCLLLAGVPPVVSASSDRNDDEAWPGEPIDDHLHMTWAALTMEVNEWADNNPDIVKLVDAGKSELGKTLWVVQISDWSMETKANGSAKEIIYIDGGHHGNEYLGTRSLGFQHNGTLRTGTKAIKKPLMFFKTRRFIS